MSPAGASAAHITRLQGLASWTRRLADLLASGAAATLAQAITRAAATAPASIAVQARALSERIGPQGIEPALRAFARELADPVGDHVAMALIVRARHGGTGLAAVLTALASDVDEQVRMRQVVLAEQRKQVGNVRMILAVVLLTWVGLLMFTRPYLAPYASPAGQLVLAVIMAGFAACLAWMMRRLRPVVGQRLLADPPRHPSARPEWGWPRDPAAADRPRGDAHPDRHRAGGAGGAPSPPAPGRHPGRPGRTAHHHRRPQPTAVSAGVRRRWLPVWLADQVSQARGGQLTRTWPSWNATVTSSPRRRWPGRSGQRWSRSCSP